MNSHIATVWRRTRRSLGCWLIALLLPVSAAIADPVSDWHAIAEQVVVASEAHPARAARNMATVSTAVFETMNFIVGRYEPRSLVKPAQPLGASGEIEGVGAAHYVLTQLYPDRKDVLDETLERFLVALPDPDAASRARIWGRQLGGTVYALSPIDGPMQSAEFAATRTDHRAVAEPWQTRVRRYVDSASHEPIERARIYALTSLATSRVYSSVGIKQASKGATNPCIACAVDAAIRTIMERGSKPQSLARIGLGHAGERTGPYQVSVSNSAAFSEDAIKAGEDIGRQIGLDILSLYRAR
ncbi:MAG: hypothetical protein ACKVQT_08110 [Burkholderiales bacterium]